MKTNIDLTYGLLKNFHRKIKLMQDKDSLVALAEFTFKEVVNVIVEEGAKDGPNH